MDIALCLVDGEKYDIATFSKLNPAALSKLRKSLVCKTCRGKGYYRKKTRDGKPACFGAYHENDCKHKLKGAKPKHDPNTIEEVNTIITDNSVIDVNFLPYSSGKPSITIIGKPTTNQISSPTKSRQHTKQPAQKRNTSRGLRSLLRMLMHSDTFANSDIEVNTGWKFPYKAKNLFVNFDDVNEELVENKKMRGYWGVISHADDNIDWLNTANKHNVSIPINKLKDYLIDVFRITDAEDLVGASVLAFGWLDISKSKVKKWYIRINEDNPAYFFVKLK